MRMVGAYVSLTEIMSTQATAARIMAIQLAQRQPRYWYTNPPISGPVTGPLRGAIDHSDMQRAKYFSVEMSTTVPGELETRAAPNRAPKKRTTMIWASDVATPQGAMRTVKMTMQTM